MNAELARTEKFRVGVVMERRRSDNRWLDFTWHPIAVIPGAPALAANGVTMTALAASGLTIAIFRASPRTTSKESNAHNCAIEFCPNMKLSSTVTRCPASSNAGVRTDPR